MSGELPMVVEPRRRECVCSVRRAEWRAAEAYGLVRVRRRRDGSSIRPLADRDWVVYDGWLPLKFLRRVVFRRLDRARERFEGLTPSGRQGMIQGCRKRDANAD